MKKNLVGIALVAAVGSLLLVPAAVNSLPGGDLLPDLTTKPPRKFTIENAEGQRRLRFTNEVLNIGRGVLEMQPKIQDCNANGDPNDDRTTYQIIYQDDNMDSRFTRGTDTTFRENRAGCNLFHTAHNHWHFEDFANYSLYELGSGGSLGALVRSSDKVTFCIIDTHRRRGSLPGSPTQAFYSKCDADDTTGISIGWSDTYTANLADQWIEITGVPDGTYCVVSTADPSNRLQEANDSNNAARRKVRITGNTVQWQSLGAC